MAFEKADRVCHSEWGFWDKTYERWRGEGFTEDITMPTLDYLSEGIDLYEHLGVMKFGYMFRDQYYVPKFNY